MGNDLTVANKAQPNQKFTVKLADNVTIRNYKGREKMQPNDVKTTYKDGQVSNYYQWGNTAAPTKEKSLNMSYNNFLIFDKLRKADGNAKNLSRKDLEALRNNKQLQKELGITVKYDANEKVYGIYGAGGSKLYFDF